MKSYDVIIIGAGLVGMATALGLAKRRYKVCIIEAKPFENNYHPSYDHRILVVNKASYNFWNHLGVWQNIKDNSETIQTVHVSQKGFYGKCTFSADELAQTQLAHTIEALALGSELQALCQANESIEFICPAWYQSLEYTSTSAQVKITIDEQNEQTLEAKLVLAADGALSKVRKDLNLDVEHKDYELTTVVASVTPEKPHQNQAFERLTNKGPTALLPYKANRCGFVWTTDKIHAQQLLDLPDEEFLRQAQKQFGYRLGRLLKVGRRSSYPLHLLNAPIQGKNRVILLGNAAHTMSPVSAQGLNLAVRDLAHLFEGLDNLGENRELGSDDMIQDYLARVKYDQQQTIKYTDDLMNWFRIESPLVGHLRGLGLLSLDKFSSIKSMLYQRVSGFKGSVPRYLNGFEEIL